MMKKTFRILALSLCAAFLLLGATRTFAHPPGDIKIEYDSTSKVLKVNIIHNSKNPKDHYIKQVKVRVDGKEMIVQDFHRQTDGTGQSISYILLDADVKSIIGVMGECNKFGKLKREMTVK